MARPRTYIISLSESDVKKLKQLIHKKYTSKLIIRRCQILLELDKNNPNQLTHAQIANTFGVCNATITNIIKDYTNHGLTTTVTYKRNPNSNATKKIDGCSEARIIELACSSPPDGYSRWTLRLLAEKSKMILDTPVSKDAIRQTLKKQNLSLTGIPTGVSHQKKTPLL